MSFAAYLSKIGVPVFMSGIRDVIARFLIDFLVGEKQTLLFSSCFCEAQAR